MLTGFVETRIEICSLQNIIAYAYAVNGPVNHVEASVDVVRLLVSIYDVISVWLITDDSFVLGPCG